MKFPTTIIPFRFVRIEEINRLKASLETFESQINSARLFIKEIENGNLSADLGSAGLASEQEHALGASLLRMRNQMQRIANEEKQRNWTTEGLAKFVDILRSNNDNLKELSHEVIVNIVKYTSANQGALYVLNEDETSGPYLQMMACYAYNRKKHLDRKIELGEGLVGQCVLEKASIYMTNLPDQYLKITSGLGEALPRNLFIVPLIMNEKVYGVIELASFNILEKYQREFVEKLAESIASTISNVHVNEKTKKLLFDSQAQAEQLRSQEEEMRQNMEELSATQEEMQRILREVEGKEAYLNQLLNASSDSIFTIDKNYKLVSWNKSFAVTLEQFGFKLQKGMNTLDWYPGDQRVKQIELYNRAFNGESFEFTASSDQQGSAYHHLSIYAPLKKDGGEVFEVAIFAKDVTQMVTAQQQADKLRQEAQNQTEELKAQEEELRQNMEELSATQDEMQRIMREVEGNEAYIKQLLNASIDSIFTIDREYKLVSWNKAFAETLEKFGMKLEKGMNTIEWYPEAERTNQIKIYERALNGESFEFTASSEQNDGTYYHLSIYAPMKDAQGKVFEVAVFAKDVTAMTVAQKKAEALAVESKKKEEYVNALLDASKDAIFTLDREFKLISFNDGFSAGLEQMGIALGKGFNILDIFPDDKQKNEQRSHYTRAFNGEKFEVTSEFNMNGQTSFYTSAFAPLKNEHGETFAIAVFGKDVTELVVSKTTAENLAKDAQETAEMMKAQEEELRQNLEELSTTQDEMERVMKALEGKSEYVTELLNASDDMIATIDRDFRLVSWNKTFELSLQRYGNEVQKGFDTMEWYPEGPKRNEQVALFKKVFQGESYETVFSTDINGQAFHFRNAYKPLRNNQGEICEIAMFTRDITSSEKKKDARRTSLEVESVIADYLRCSKYDVHIVDRDAKLLYFNNAFAKTMEPTGITPEIGKDLISMLPDKKEQQALLAQITRVFKGESFDQVQEFHANNITAYAWLRYHPIRNIDGEVIAASIRSEDITALITGKEKSIATTVKVKKN